MEDTVGRLAQQIADDAKDLAPVDTGHLRESAGLQREGIDLHYRQTPWRYQDEEGNWHYTEGMKPQPFFYSAMKQNEDELMEKLKATAVLEIR